VIRLFLAVSLICAVLGAAGTAFAQQQPAPGGPPKLETCSQQAAYCVSGCSTSTGSRQCHAACESHRTDCMATGLWKSLINGEMLPRRKE
jgi:hypothetical protein